MIKTIIFDLGGVIIPLDFQRGYDALEGRCPHSAAEIKRRIATTDLLDLFEIGQVEPEQFVKEMCKMIDLDLSLDEFQQAWSTIFLPDTLVPESLLEAISSRYRLLLLSNTNSIHFQFILKNYPLMRHFHDYILSYDVGALKPAPEIYRAALSKAGCQPSECFFTDDILENVEGARREGLDAEQFISYEQIKRELESREIEL